MKALLAAFCLAAALPAVAAAHPHSTPEPPKPDTRTKAWPFSGSATTESDGGTVIRIERDGRSELELDTKELEANALELAQTLKESEMVDSLARMLSDLADSVDVERGEGRGTALMFDGEEMLRFKLDRDVLRDEALSITGLGRNLTVERETVVEDGRSRTRIVIEMDGGEDVDIALPKPRD